MIRNKLFHFSIALFEVGKELNILDETLTSLKFVRDVLDKNEKFLLFFDSPLIEKEIKKQVFSNVFKDRINKYVIYFSFILIDYNVMKYYHRIYREFKHIYNREKGILEGKIYTPFTLNEERILNLETIFKKKYNKPIEFRQVYQKNLIGGIKIIIEDQIYDYSLNNKLNVIKDNLIKNIKWGKKYDR